MRDELAARPHDHREAVLADADLVHHPPHLFEADLAHERSRRLVEPRQVDRERRGRQLVFVEADRRHRDVVEGNQHVLRHLDARTASAAGDVILQDAILLPPIEAGILEVRSQRLEQLGVGRDVAADLGGGARGDVAVAGHDRLAGAALERQKRDGAVGDERYDGGRGEEQRETRRDVPDSERHQQLGINCGWRGDPVPA